ncbi:MAG: thiopurine S-methyltransferase, partial [Hydrogenovibrio sp.]|nr:thiopurine S-methyltransferase [Hydrogenovibrio sp.]
METRFWHDMWASGKVGFHQPEVNDFLQAFWSKLKVDKSAQVLVPLSGKSLDMLWLQQQGHSVIGVELSQKALDEFVTENQLLAEPVQHRRFCGYQLKDMVLYCGDFFHLSSEDCREVAAVYDRAALVALPPEMRQDYVKHLLEILPEKTPMLLIAMDYDQSQTNGPPFAVSASEIHRLYGEHYQIEKVQEERFNR